jgi:hypothetical protein
MEREIWIAVCAHRLQRQWRTIDPDQLDELAADLWKDERLRRMAPDEAATHWLEPLALGRPRTAPLKNAGPPPD